MKRYSLHSRRPVAGKVLPVDIHNPSEETIDEVSSVLCRGGAVVYPSDTVYGILADADRRASCSHVASLKGYTELRPFIVLLNSIDSAMELTSRIDADEIMNKYWPGGVTLVFPASDTAPEWLVGKKGTIAMRMPADPLTKAVLKGTGLKLVSTSANQRGGETPLSLADIPEAVKSLASLILDGGALAGREPSRILDFTGNRPVILR